MSAGLTLIPFLQEAKLVSKTVAVGEKSVSLVREATDELESVRNETKATLDRVAEAVKVLDEAGVVKSEKAADKGDPGRGAAHAAAVPGMRDERASQDRAADLVNLVTEAADATIDSLLTWDGHVHDQRTFAESDALETAAIEAEEGSAEHKIQDDLSGAKHAAAESLSKAEGALSKLDEARRLYKMQNRPEDDEGDDASGSQAEGSSETTNAEMQPAPRSEGDAEGPPVESQQTPEEHVNEAAEDAEPRLERDDKDAAPAASAGASAENTASTPVDGTPGSGAGESSAENTSADVPAGASDSASAEANFPLDGAVTGLESAKEAMRKSAMALNEAEAALALAFAEARDEEQRSAAELGRERNDGWHGADDLLHALGFDGSRTDAEAGEAGGSTGGVALEEIGANKTKFALTDAMHNLAKAYEEVNITVEAARTAAEESEKDVKQKLGEIKQQYKDAGGSVVESPPPGPAGLPPATDFRDAAETGTGPGDAGVAATLGRKGGVGMVSELPLAAAGSQATADVSETASGAPPPEPPSVPLAQEAAALAKEIAADLESSKEAARAEKPEVAARAEALAEALAESSS